MTSETFSPMPLNPETARLHVVVPGEVVSSNVAARKERVSDIPSEEVMLWKDVSLADIENTRQTINAHKEEVADPLFHEKMADLAVDEALPYKDPADPQKYERDHRGAMKQMLLLDDKRFERKALRYKKAKAYADGVILERKKKPDALEDDKTSFLDTIRERFHERELKNPSANQLKREIKRIDRQFDGLLGEIAETGTKPEYLEAKHAAFAVAMAAHGHEVNDVNRRAAERETVRKLVDVKQLAKHNHIAHEDIKSYEDNMVDVFHRYASLQDEQRQEFSRYLADRIAKRKQLDVVEAEAETDEKDSRLDRVRVSLGKSATKLVGNASRRWQARKDQTVTTDTSSEDDDKQAALARTRSDRLKDTARKAAELPLVGYNRFTNHLALRKQAEAEKLSKMNDQERDEYMDKKKRRNRTVAIIGGVGVVLVGAAVARYGFDMFDRSAPAPTHTSGGEGGLADLLNIPSIDQDTVGGDHLHRAQVLHRGELFGGEGGSRHLSGANIDRLHDFLDTYKVKTSDDRGVWEISEKYLKSQGISNPSVFETDAVKDYILGHSSLTSSSIIHPGDTIKLK